MSDIVSALVLADDLQMGYTWEHSTRVCFMAMRMA